MFRLRKSHITMFLLAGIVAHAGAQAQRKTVVWSDDPACGWKSASVQASDVYVCDATVTARGQVSGISHNGISLAVAFLDDGPYLTVAVRVANGTVEPLIFDTDEWGAAHFKRREDFYSRKRPIAAETSLPSRDALRLLSGRARADNEIDEYLADVQQTIETVEVKRADGTRTRVKRTVPDSQEQEAAQRRSQARSEMALIDGAKLRRNALTAKTVLANDSVKGLVYFRRMKKAEFVVFTFALGDTNYVFLLPRENKKTS